MAAKFSNNMIVGDLYRAPPKMRELGIYPYQFYTNFSDNRGYLERGQVFTLLEFSHPGRPGAEWTIKVLVADTGLSGYILGVMPCVFEHLITEGVDGR